MELSSQKWQPRDDKTEISKCFQGLPFGEGLTFVLNDLLD